MSGRWNYPHPILFVSLLGFLLVWNTKGFGGEGPKVDVGGTENHSGKVLTQSESAGEGSASEDSTPEDSTAVDLALGQKIRAVQSVLRRHDHSPAGLKLILDLGHDSRYYVLTRGWLNEELRGVESQLEAARDPALRTKFSEQIQFLRRAIRRLDLE